MKTLPTITDLKKQYPLIPAYSKIMGSYDYWTEQQLWLAHGMNAPADTYRVEQNSSKYYTLADISNQNLIAELKELAKK